MLKKLFMVGSAFWIYQNGLSQISDSAQVLEEVVVTATKFEKKQDQTGKTVTVISRRQIEEHPGQSLSQLLQNHAGIGIAGANNNAGSEQVFYLRGANSGRTLVLIDGVPSGDPSLINAEFDLNQVSPQQVERVEILRGAQSTLYGSSAIAGVINIITRKGSSNPLSVNALLGYGSRNSLKGSVQLSGSKDRFDYSGNYGYDITNGFSAAAGEAGTSHYDNDGFSRHTATARVGYKAHDNLTLRVFMQHFSYEADIDAGAFSEEADHQLTNKGTTAGFHADFARNKWKLRTAYRFQEVRRSYLNDSIDVPGFTKYLYNPFYGRNHFAEVYSSHQLSDHAELLLGVDYQQQSAHSHSLTISSFGPYESLFNPPHMELLAAYATFHAKTGFVDLEAGGRLNHHSKYGYNATYSINPSISLSGNARLYASISTGFKSPSLYQLYSSSGEENLHPEKALTAELGIQARKKTLFFRQTVFYRKIKNGLDFDYNSFKYFNFLQQKGWGLETELTWKMLEKLELTTAYTFLDFEETTQSRIDHTAHTYPYLLRRPKHQANASLSWKLNEKWLARFSARWVGKRWDVSGYQAPDEKLEAYGVYNFYVAFKPHHSFSLFSDCQNIFNKTYFDVLGFNTTPFTLFAGIKWNWP